MVWLAGEAGIQTNLASLAAAGLSLAINLEKFEKYICSLYQCCHKCIFKLLKKVSKMCSTLQGHFYDNK